MKHCHLLSIMIFVGLACSPIKKENNDNALAKIYSIEQFMDIEKIGGRSFSPDENKVLFHSNKSGVFNAYEANISTGKIRQLTHSDSNAVIVISYFPKDERFLFRSDKGGNEISHLYLCQPNGEARDLTPESTAKAKFIDWNHAKNAFFFISNKRNPKFFDIYKMNIDNFKTELIYKNDDGLDPILISKDERYIALHQSITTNVSKMYLYDRTTKIVKSLNLPNEEVQMFPQKFSLNNEKLYYLTNRNSEFLYASAYNLISSEHEVVKTDDWDVQYLSFSAREKYQVAVINKDARTEINVVETASQKPLKMPIFPQGDISSVIFSESESKMLFYVNSSQSPNNLYVYDLATSRAQALTNVMNEEINAADLVTGKVIRYKSFDSLEIPAILYEPKNRKTNEKSAAILNIHGGPGGQSRLNYSPLVQYLVNHGYVVLSVNNRGSSGYGKTFFAADDRKHGEADLKDCIESKKFLASLGYVDTARVAIMGGSYGGYMTLAGLAFTPDEFAAGIDIFGVSNWLRTLNSVPPWWESFRQALYKEVGNPKTDSVMLYNKSPLFHAKNIKKPLLVIQGNNDARVLKVESDEIVEAVKKNGVPVEYVTFADEGHGFVKKENEIIAYKAVLSFLDKHLQSKKIDKK